MAASRLTLLATKTLFVVAVTARRSTSTLSSCPRYTWRSYSQLAKSSCIINSATNLYKQPYSTDKELKWNDVGSVELVAMLQANDVQLIDVREPYELIEDGRIESSVNIPLGEIGEALGLSNEEFYDKYGVQKPTKGDTNIVFHCRSGIRSLTALNVAYEMGYSNARHYYPGYLGWAEFQDRQQ